MYVCKNIKEFPIFIQFYFIFIFFYILQVLHFIALCFRINGNVCNNNVLAENYQYIFQIYFYSVVWYWQGCR